jgi:hypothetical protein
VQDNSAVIEKALGVVSYGSMTRGGADAPSDSSDGGCGCGIGRRNVTGDFAVLLGLCGVALFLRYRRRH